MQNSSSLIQISSFLMQNRSSLIQNLSILIQNSSIYINQNDHQKSHCAMCGDFRPLDICPKTRTIRRKRGLFNRTSTENREHFEPHSALWRSYQAQTPSSCGLAGRRTSNCKRIGNFPTENHHFPGAILHSLCIFIRNSKKQSGISIAIRIRRPQRDAYCSCWILTAAAVLVLREGRDHFGVISRLRSQVRIVPAKFMILIPSSSFRYTVPRFKCKSSRF